MTRFSLSTLSARQKLWAGLALAAAVQTAVLAWMVWDRVSLLKSGREITMRVVPVDPRDIFRGDYVVLGYELSPLKGAEGGNEELPKGLYTGAAVYVTIAPDAENNWKPVGFAARHPGKVEASQAVLKGRIVDVYGCRGPGSGDCSLNVRYGIESYFVPEGQGLKLEQLVRERKVEAVVALGSGGDAMLKALLVDGQRVSQEPLL